MLGLPWPFPFFGGNFTEVKVAGNVPRDRIAPPSLPSPPPLPPFWPLELCVVITIRRIHTNRRTHQPANGYLHFGGGGMHDTQASARSGPLPSPSEVIARAPQAAALLDHSASCAHSNRLCRCPPQPNNAIMALWTDLDPTHHP